MPEIVELVRRAAPAGYGQVDPGAEQDRRARHGEFLLLEAEQEREGGAAEVEFIGHRDERAQVTQLDGVGRLGQARAAGWPAVLLATGQSDADLSEAVRRSLSAAGR